MAALTCHMSAIILDLLALVSADRPSTRSGDVNVSYYIREQLSTGGGLVYARRFEQHEIAKVADLGDQWTDIYTDLYGVWPAPQSEVDTQPLGSMSTAR